MTWPPVDGIIGLNAGFHWPIEPPKPLETQAEKGENRRKPVKAKGRRKPKDAPNWRKPAKADENQRKPARTGRSQKKPAETRANQSKPKRTSEKRQQTARHDPENRRRRRPQWVGKLPRPYQPAAWNGSRGLTIGRGACMKSKSTILTPKQVLDMYYLDARLHILEIAAMLDRGDRGHQDAL